MNFFGAFEELQYFTVSMSSAELCGKDTFSLFSMPDEIAVWQSDIKSLQNISAIKLKFRIILDLL